MQDIIGMIDQAVTVNTSELNLLLDGYKSQRSVMSTDLYRGRVELDVNTKSST